MHRYKVSFGKVGRVGEERDDVEDENETDVFFMNLEFYCCKKRSLTIDRRDMWLNGWTEDTTAH